MFEDRRAIPGLVDEGFDPRDVWEDEVLSGDESLPLPTAYAIEGLVYEPQGAYPFCTSFACTTLLECKYGGKLSFSQQHLFFHAGGGRGGSGFRANLDVLQKKGAIPYARLPMPDVKFGRGSDWLERLKPTAMAVPFWDPKMLVGYARVVTDEVRLKRAIMQYGPLLVGVAAGKGDYYSGKGKRVPQSVDNHAVLLVGWTDSQWIIFESLWWAKDAKGYATLDGSYRFNSAYAVTELPGNWKEIRDNVRSGPFANALNHYGKRRDFEAEQRFAVDMLDAFRLFNNKSVTDAAGRFWAVLINAGVYGGYSLTYTKWGVTQPGDLINFVYHWRRTGENLFDLDQPRIK
jgi:hypothetical protein